MTDTTTLSTGLAHFHTELTTINQLLAQTVAQLTRLADALQSLDPNYRRPLADFSTFDWTTIRAAVVSIDQDGPTEVRWAGHLWKRRAGDGKFGRAIWYSRPTGRTDEGTTYARLITFKNYDPAEPLPFAPPPASAAKPRPPYPNGNNPPTPAVQTFRQDVSPPRTYANGAEVPSHPATQATYDAYIAANNQPPRDGPMLRAWHQAQ